MSKDDDKLTCDNIGAHIQELGNAVASGTVNYQDLQHLLSAVNYRINELEQKHTGDSNTDKSSDSGS